MTVVDFFIANSRFLVIPRLKLIVGGGFSGLKILGLPTNFRGQFSASAIFP